MSATWFDSERDTLYLDWNTDLGVSMDPLDFWKTDASKVTHLASFDGLVPGWINIHNDIERSMYEA